MISATPAQQRRLLDLQRVDTAIRQLEHRRANLPEQKTLDENADILRRVNAEHAAAKEELGTLQRRQTRHEQEIATVDARRKSEEGRMYSGLITSERELEALRGELSALRSRKNDLEDTLLDIMERAEELASLVASLEERNRELSAQVSDLSAERDRAATDIDEELTGLGQQRAQIAADIDGAVLTYYEELRDRKAGLAVAELDDRTCMGCHLQLTPIELEETREAVVSGLAKCPQCGRILVLGSTV